MTSESGDPISIEEIISESMKEINEISEEAYVYLKSLSKDQLITRITRSKARKIARELLSIMDIEVEE